MSIPSVSVAMSAYNCAPYLAQAIESILAQSFTDFEFLILNDGSHDDSAAIIDRYAARDSRIRAIHRENRGLIASLNELIAESRAPLIARMDGDDIALPDRFAKQVTFLDSHPDHGVVGTWTRDIDGDGNPYRLNGMDHPTSHEEFMARIGHGSLLCHPATIFRKAVVEQVGGYHAAFRHCEDLDLWLRLTDVTRLCSLPERLLLYRHTDSQVSSRHAVEQQVNAAVSIIAWHERQAGRPDPTATLDALPPIDGLDALFGRDGIANEVVMRVTPSLLYSRAALTTTGLDIIARHLRAGGERSGLWRTVARLLRFGEPRHALHLASLLLLP